MFIFPKKYPSYNYSTFSQIYLYLYLSAFLFILHTTNDGHSKMIMLINPVAL